MTFPVYRAAVTHKSSVRGFKTQCVPRMKPFYNVGEENVTSLVFRHERALPPYRGLRKESNHVTNPGG